MNNSTTPVNERNEWRTPEALVKYCTYQVGELDYDTACTLDNAVAKPVWWSNPSLVGYRDAFAREWKGRCFCNPPYDNIKPWVEKALRSNAITVMVLPSPNGEKVYRELLGTSFEIHIIGRVSFIGLDGKPRNGNPRGTSIFVVYSPRNIGVRSFIDRSCLLEFGCIDRPAPVWTPPCS